MINPYFKHYLGQFPSQQKVTETDFQQQQKKIDENE